MRLDNAAREVQTSGIMQSSRATIKAEAKIFNFFSDQTYSNKPLAIARELVANGVDSHIAAGIPHRAVELTLPIALDPIFRVRDFGIGMSRLFLIGDPDNGIPSQFMTYADGSTKDQSNDQIGGFGIGSKSPFSYCDQFTIRSVCDGELCVCSVYKAEDGVPEIGLLAFDPNTSEPNGVEVSFPVEVADIETFHEVAQAALQYFKPTPIVINGTITPIDYMYEGTGWAIRHEAGSLGVIMGGVRYPVSTANLSYALRSSTELSPLLEYGLDLFMPIGSCGVALSREHLSYTDLTNASIKAHLEGLLDDVTATFATLFDPLPSMWEASAALAKQVGFDDAISNPRAKLLKAHARYRGQELRTDVSTRQVWGQLWKIEAARERGSGTTLRTIKWEGLRDHSVLFPGKIQTLILDDLEDSPKSKVGAKVREFAVQSGRTGQTIVLRLGKREREGYDQLLLALGSPQSVVWTSDLPEPPKKTRVKNKARPLVRMFQLSGRRDSLSSTIENLTPAHRKRDVLSEIDFNVQPSSGIYVPLNSFDLPPGFWKKMDTGVMRLSELHFLNVGDAEKLDKEEWEDFETVFRRRIDAMIADDPDMPTRIALYHNPVFSEFWPTCRALRYDTLTNAQLKRPLGQMMQLWRTYVHPLSESQLMVAAYVKAALPPPRVEPDKLVAAYKATQPDVEMLRGVLDLSIDQHRAFFLKNL